MLSSKGPKAMTPDKKKFPTSLIVTGNPNVGKSVLFHALTGRYAMVSNYPGTTVMIEKTRVTLGGTDWEVSDTPGLNSLAASSEDELVAREVLTASSATVLQVGNVKHLERTLALTLELAETGQPMVLALNMMDEAKEARIKLDREMLQELLGIPVIATVATERHGIENLKQALGKSLPSPFRCRYPAVIENAAAEIEKILPVDFLAKKTAALLWLSNDTLVRNNLQKLLTPAAFATLTEITERAESQSRNSLASLISRSRLREAERIARLVTSAGPDQTAGWSLRFGDLAMHPVWGIPILGLVLLLMYWLVGNLAAQQGVNFTEKIVFGKYLSPAIRWIVNILIPWPWLRALFIGDYGLFSMALPYAFGIILPIMTMFFLCFGILEDTGYLPRLAVMGHRFCKILGLNGKAILPLILGLGCATMATMTTRVLDSKRDRLLATFLLALGIPCSAQLGAIAAMLAHRPFAAFLVWFSVVLALLILGGRCLSAVLPKADNFFLYEIPPIRKPQMANIAAKTLGRLEWYLKEAVPLFFLGTFFLFILNLTGALTFLETISRPLVVEWLGLPARATDALLMGFLRRDFGAAGFYTLEQEGLLNGIQVVVSLVTITLFVPCIAQYFMMIKERGLKTANVIAVTVVGLAFLTGGILFRVLSWLKLPL